MPTTPVTSSNSTQEIDTTSLAPGNYVSTSILNHIYNSIIELLGSLQSVAAAQANRLNFESKWQQAYTNLMGQVHTFIANNGDYIAGSSTDDLNARDDLNKLNANLIQTLQNRQSVISDSAKALQSSVNQSNDAVNQQSNLGTSIVQQLSTLLGTIYR